MQCFDNFLHKIVYQYGILSILSGRSLFTTLNVEQELRRSAERGCKQRSVATTPQVQFKPQKLKAYNYLIQMEF